MTRGRWTFVFFHRETGSSRMKPMDASLGQRLADKAGADARLSVLTADAARLLLEDVRRTFIGLGDSLRLP